MKACTKLGERAISAHRALINTSRQLRNLRDELNYERAHDHRRVGQAPRDFQALRRQIKDVEGSMKMAQLKFDRLIRKYRRECE